MSPSSPRPPRRQRWLWRKLRLRFYAGEAIRELNYATDIRDRAHDLTEDRLVRLEEIVFAGWPRSMALRRRLRAPQFTGTTGTTDLTSAGQGQ